MKEELTRERALELHRQMWTDMQRECGDNPAWFVRNKFKHKWCEEHGFEDVDCNCFLCEYSSQNDLWCSGNCPIDWSQLTNDPDHDYSTCTDTYKDDVYNALIYEAAPISAILALPERSFDDERK